MSGDAHKLDLDELFGSARPVKVVWKGVEYELPRPEAFSPKAWAGFSHLQDKIITLQSFGAQLTDEQAQELDKIASDCIMILSPRLAKCNLPFFVKVQVIKFYGDQIAPTGQEAKNLTGSLTGEASSVGSASGTE